MDNTDFLKKFLDMEETAGSVIEHFTTENGDNVWLYMRTLFNAYVNGQGNLGKLPVINVPKQTKFGIVPFVQKALTTIPQGGGIIFSSLSLHTEKYNGKLFDPYLDPALQEIARIGILPVKIVLDYEIPNDAEFVISPLQIFPLTISSQIWKPCSPIIRSYPIYQKFCRKFGIPAVPWQNIIRYWLNVTSFAEFWTQILSILKPRLVVLECYYNERNMGLSTACRSLSIPCIEYQHGFQNWPHIPYNLPYIPKDGYNALPEWFFHWGERSAQRLQRYFAGQSYHKCLVAGKPAYIAWKRGVTRDVEREQKLDAVLAGRIPIGVALPVGQGEVYALLEAAINQAPSEWIWLLRSHPVFGAPWAKGQDLAGRFPDKTETELSSQIPLHSLLQRCRHLVTGFSTTAIEAVSLHHMSASCIHPEAKVFLKESIDAGEMQFCDSVEALLDDISCNISMCTRKSSLLEEISENEMQMISAFKHVIAYETAIKKNLNR